MPGRRGPVRAAAHRARRPDRRAAGRPARSRRRPAGAAGANHPGSRCGGRSATAAAGASSEREFFARLDAAGIVVRKRFSTRNPGEVTGYAVALPADTTSAGGPVWYSGGKLAADLTLPKLRHRWDARPATSPAGVFTPAERNAV